MVIQFRTAYQETGQLFNKTADYDYNSKVSVPGLIQLDYDDAALLPQVNLHSPSSVGVNRTLLFILDYM